MQTVKDIVLNEIRTHLEKNGWFESVVDKDQYVLDYIDKVMTATEMLGVVSVAVEAYVSKTVQRTRS